MYYIITFIGFLGFCVFFTTVLEVHKDIYQIFFTFHFSFRCNYEQAIVLASYSLQAESGDHDPERHTLENLQDLPLLPKIMMSQLSEERFGKK